MARPKRFELLTPRFSWCSRSRLRDGAESISGAAHGSRTVTQARRRRVEVITSCLRSKIETNFVLIIRNGYSRYRCPTLVLSCAPPHPGARPFIGHSLDSDREVYTKSLKSLALPRGPRRAFAFKYLARRGTSVPSTGTLGFLPAWSHRLLVTLQEIEKVAPSVAPIECGRLLRVYWWCPLSRPHDPYYLLCIADVMSHQGCRSYSKPEMHRRSFSAQASSDGPTARARAEG